MSESDLLELFERTFRSGYGSCRVECKCGKTYYDHMGRYDWDVGELDALRARPETAIPVDHSIGGVRIGGVDYAECCTCWHPLAHKIIQFMVSHDVHIANFLNARRECLIKAARVVADVVPRPEPTLIRRPR